MPGFCILKQDTVKRIRITFDNDHKVIAPHVQIFSILLRGVADKYFFGGISDSQPLFLFQIFIDRIPAGSQRKVGDNAPFKKIVVHDDPLLVDHPDPEKVIDFGLRVISEQFLDAACIRKNLQIFHIGSGLPVQVGVKTYSFFPATVATFPRDF